MDLLKKERLENAEKVVKTLIKEATLGNQLAEVKAVFDTSGSMSGLYTNNTVQAIFERIFPICMAFDDDGEMPAYEFSNRTKRVPVDVTINNIEGYVRSHMRPDYMATVYSEAINKVVEDYKSGNSKPGLISKLFGAKGSDPKPILPLYVLFLTDGECNSGDKELTKQALINASNYPIFFQFVGLKTHSSTDFELLKTLDTMTDRKIDNANFFEISTKSFGDLSDRELYSLLLKEFPSFIKLALDLDMID